MTLKQNLLNLAISLEEYSADEQRQSDLTGLERFKGFFQGRASAFKQSAAFIRDRITLHETINGEGV